MNTWIWIWGLLLLATLCLYAGLTVVVTIGGFIDIRQMFKTLGSQHEGKKEGGTEPADDD